MIDESLGEYISQERRGRWMTFKVNRPGAGFGRLKRFRAVEQNRHGPVIRQRYFHHRLEYTRLDFEAETSYTIDEVLIKLICLLGLGGIAVRRPSSSPYVAVKRELRNDEN